MSNTQSGGAVDISVNHKPSGGLYLTNTQSNLVNGSYTIVLLETVSADFTESIEDTANHKITPGVAGYYLIIGQIAFNATVADKGYGTFIAKNGVDVKSMELHSAKAGKLIVSFVGIMKLTDTDYIQLRAVSRSGDDTADITGGEGNTFLILQRIR